MKAQGEEGPLHEAQMGSACHSRFIDHTSTEAHHDGPGASSSGVCQAGGLAWFEDTVSTKITTAQPLDNVSTAEFILDFRAIVIGGLSRKNCYNIRASIRLGI